MQEQKLLRLRLDVVSSQQRQYAAHYRDRGQQKTCRVARQRECEYDIIACAVESWQQRVKSGYHYEAYEDAS